MDESEQDRIHLDNTHETLIALANHRQQTAVMKALFSDLRVLLRYVERQWIAPELVPSLRRLRAVVGEVE